MLEHVTRNTWQKVACLFWMLKAERAWYTDEASLCAADTCHKTTVGPHAQCLCHTLHTAVFDPLWINIPAMPFGDGAKAACMLCSRMGMLLDVCWLGAMLHA